MDISVDSLLMRISKKLMSLKKNLAHQRFLADHHSYSNEIDGSLRKWRENLITIFSRSIIENTDETYSKLKDWGLDGVNLLINLHLPLDLAIEEVRFYRNTMGEIIKQESIKYEITLEDFYDIISRFDSIVDRAVHWLSLSYSKRFDARILAADTFAMELSIPVIKVTEEIGVLPLIGDIDTKRAQELMDKALNVGTNLGLSHMVIDLSAVPIIDTMVANHLFKIIDALKLVGIKVILTGIRSEIAQTMVSLGIQLNGVATFASLQQAMKKILN